MPAFVKGPSRKIIVDLTLNVILEASDCHSWRKEYPSCTVNGFYILQKLIFVAENCFLDNMVKNYNSIVISRATEKRKLKNFY